jgi:hypothetical protein
MTDKQTADLTAAEIAELFGGEVEPIIMTPEEKACLERHMAYVEKYGHQP